MSELNPLDFSKSLSKEEINKLAELAINYPLSEQWKTIAQLLTPEQKIQINKKINAIKFEKSENKKPLKEGQGMDEPTWNRLVRTEADKFYGNMGQPETPEEFKNRYGVWPPGYDENGNKI